jgi:hypothetical protein
MENALVFGNKKLQTMQSTIKVRTSFKLKILKVYGEQILQLIIKIVSIFGILSVLKEFPVS